MSYDGHFFNAMRTGSDRSAAIVVPRVLEYLHPLSVVDIGCGEGVWLAQFLASGITDIMGLDGSYVRTERLAIPVDRFVARNLLSDWQLSRRFDLAVCLEVAEHLDPAFAEELVRRLVRLAPFCLFSAAIPYQGGTHHVNEQWQDYWAEKFVHNGFKVFDVLRAGLWNEPLVGYVYAQNILLYADPSAVQTHAPGLLAHEYKGPLGALAKVHPRKWLKKAGKPVGDHGIAARARRLVRRLMPAR